MSNFLGVVGRIAIVLLFANLLFEMLLVAHAGLAPLVLLVIAGDRKLTEEMDRDPTLQIRFLNGEEIKKAMITGFRQALAGGVKIGAGTDAGLVDHGSVWKELQYFVEIGGISPELALHLGTLGTAESIGLDDITGSVAIGKFADLLVVDEDPRSDLSTLARPRLIVAAGVIVEPTARGGRRHPQKTTNRAE